MYSVWYKAHQASNYRKRFQPSQVTDQAIQTPKLYRTYNIRQKLWDNRSTSVSAVCYSSEARLHGGGGGVVFNEAIVGAIVVVLTYHRTVKLFTIWTQPPWELQYSPSQSPALGWPPHPRPSRPRSTWTRTSRSSRSQPRALSSRQFAWNRAESSPFSTSQFWSRNLWRYRASVW